MEEGLDGVHDFFNSLWRFTADKHNQGVYNTVCLVVLLTFPLLVLITTLVVCCHCCCCRHADGCRCCCWRGSKSDAKKKKKGSTETEDLWISVKTRPMTPDSVGLAMM